MSFERLKYLLGDLYGSCNSSVFRIAKNVEELASIIDEALRRIEALENSRKEDTCHAADVSAAGNRPNPNSFDGGATNGSVNHAAPPSNILEKHPAPWTIRMVYGDIVDVNDKEVVMGAFEVMPDRQVADLILAAPELLAVLIELTRYAANDWISEYRGFAFHPVIQHARATIAKVMGEPEPIDDRPRWQHGSQVSQHELLVALKSLERAVRMDDFDGEKFPELDIARNLIARVEGGK